MMSDTQQYLFFGNSSELAQGVAGGRRKLQSETWGVNSGRGRNQFFLAGGRPLRDEASVVAVGR